MWIEEEGMVMIWVANRRKTRRKEKPGPCEAGSGGGGRAVEGEDSQDSQDTRHYAGQLRHVS
jgi:hypothetical protein